MSDLAIPSWRPRQEKQGPSWRMLAFAGGALGLVAVGGAIAWGVSRMGPQPVPVIEPDTRPVKVRPENPGGLIVPNQDQLVLQPPEVRREAERRSGSARLGAGPESPQLDLLRQQAAPPEPPQAQPAPAPVPVPQQMSALGNAPQLAPPVAAPPAAPAVAPATPAAPRLAPVPGGRTMVQLGALVSEEAARAEWARIVKRVPELAAFQPRISRLEREGQDPLFRLRTGGLADAAAAKALCEAVRAKGAACNPIGG
ncbi:SPOR domain-containing protein [Roseicella aquatilis]|uniref:SPOR domain-containing protein n=1 Tax=Roseicella aquatilis TaxID=2527868 RepID=A0A4R4DVU6_9PROT|nr:SPOR domain-containing protein [Roseicella aquatilis]TCZ66695.1 SPOR domain-containing protein [Roseicella aquatilis]